MMPFGNKNIRHTLRAGKSTSLLLATWRCLISSSVGIRWNDMTEYDLTPSQIPGAKHENIEKLWIFQIYVKLPEFFFGGGIHPTFTQHKLR